MTTSFSQIFVLTICSKILKTFLWVGFLTYQKIKNKWQPPAPPKNMKTSTLDDKSYITYILHWSHYWYIIQTAKVKGMAANCCIAKVYYIKQGQDLVAKARHKAAAVLIWFGRHWQRRQGRGTMMDTNVTEQMAQWGCVVPLSCVFF